MFLSRFCGLILGRAFFGGIYYRKEFFGLYISYLEEILHLKNKLHGKIL